MLIDPLSVLFGVRALHTWDQVMEAFHGPLFRWKVHQVEGGRYAYAVLSGNRETGEVWVLEVMENCTAPEHVHTPNEKYGELVIIIDGELRDVTDQGAAIILGKGGILVHNIFRPHAPSARFVVLLFHQPRGSKLVADLPPDLLATLEGSG
jgi:hypothetical protein